MIGTKFIKGNYNQAEYEKCADWCNANGATIVDRGEYFECVKVEEVKEIQVETLKSKLAETDYVVLKIFEGVASEKEYADVLEQRKQWRKEINDLEDK